MIITERKPFEEVKKYIDKYNNIFVVSCGDCCAVCKTGGTEGAKEIIEKIEAETGKKIPEAVVVEPTHGLYTAYSKKVMAIFDDYTPKKEQLSIDEAFLDMTGCDHLFGGIEAVAKEIQQRIYPPHLYPWYMTPLMQYHPHIETQ